MWMYGQVILAPVDEALKEIVVPIFSGLLLLFGYVEQLPPRRVQQDPRAIRLAFLAAKKHVTLGADLTQARERDDVLFHIPAFDVTVINRSVGIFYSAY